MSKPPTWMIAFDIDQRTRTYTIGVILPAGSQNPNKFAGPKVYITADDELGAYQAALKIVEESNKRLTGVRL